VRNLSQSESEALLERGKIARLGVYDEQERRVYLVPVSYTFHEGTAYLHSAPGHKLDLLRQQPDGICLEVDEIGDEGEWQSAVGWGRFEEIDDASDRAAALRSFGDRLRRGPLRDRSTAGRAGMLCSGETVYRIVLDEITGRADSSGWHAIESD
jgi:nitroimidazol reductase NimA-like FMN-containing flavoprotein (pyridoxamine 5'-phosphate oxidase superfamily)